MKTVFGHLSADECLRWAYQNEWYSELMSIEINDTRIQMRL